MLRITLREHEYCLMVTLWTWIKWTVPLHNQITRYIIFRRAWGYQFSLSNLVIWLKRARKIPPINTDQSCDMVEEGTGRYPFSLTKSVIWLRMGWEIPILTNHIICFRGGGLEYINFFLTKSFIYFVKGLGEIMFN